MLAGEGAVVVVHGRDEARAHEAAQQIEADGGRVEVVLGELASPEGCAEVVRAVQDRLGGLTSRQQCRRRGVSGRQAIRGYRR